MTESQPDPVALTDEALLEIIEQYHERIDSGESVDRDAFVAMHPGHRDQLLAYFADLNVVESLAGPTIESATEGTLISGETHNGAIGETMIESSQSDTSNMRVAADAPRTRFGRYRLLKELGRGAMGAVYLAHDEQLDREIALKIPQFGQDMDPSLLERFYREARAAAALRHPGICPVFDVGEIDGQHYITMAFIKGRPLRDFTKTTKRQGIQQVVRVIRKLALAMAEAHKFNVTHRDLKPANVMIDERKEPVVMDFGLARRATEGEEKLTHSGTVIGTPAYMSPEQVDGDNERVGPPADIYSLGVMFYEMLTGRLPFQGNLMSILKQIATEDPSPPTKLRGEIPLELEAVCLKMMAKQIEDRYETMEQVASDLTDFLKQKNVSTEESGVLETTKPPAVHPIVMPQIEVTEPVSLPPALRPAPAEASLPSIKPDQSATTVRRPRPSFGGASKRNLLIGGGLGGAAILLAGIVFIVQLGKITVQITVDDPSLALKVDGDEVVIEGEGAPIRLSAGTHELIVKRDGLEFSPKEFKVTKNGKNAIHVVVVGERVQILTDGKRPPKRGGGGTQFATRLPPATAPVDLERGLVGHWNFEEGEGTRVADSSGNGNHGTLKGSDLNSVWSQNPPPIGTAGSTCLTLDAKDQRVEIASSKSLEITNELTISAWTRINAVSPGERSLYASDLVIKGGNDSYRLTCTELFVLGFGAHQPSTSNRPQWSEFPIGQWRHVLARYDGKTMRVYRDGTMVTERATNGGPIGSTPAAVVLGRQSPTQSRNISIDDVRIYNRAVSDSEIAVLAGKASAPKAGGSSKPVTPLPAADASQVNLKRGLIGHWDFEEGQGDRVADSSGNGNHGTLEGNVAAVWSRDVPSTPLAGKSCVTLSDVKDRVSIPASPSLHAANAITISAWTRIDKLGGEVRDVVNKGSNTGYRVYGNGRLWVGTDQGGLISVKNANFKTESRWFHVAATYDGNRLRVYTNGELTGESPHSGPLQASEHGILLGRANQGTPTVVSIDDVRIYNRALTESEIAVLAGKAALPNRPSVSSTAIEPLGELNTGCGFSGVGPPALESARPKAE